MYRLDVVLVLVHAIDEPKQTNALQGMNAFSITPTSIDKSICVANGKAKVIVNSKTKDIANTIRNGLGEDTVNTICTALADAMANIAMRNTIVQTDMDSIAYDRFNNIGLAFSMALPE